MTLHRDTSLFPSMNYRRRRPNECSSAPQRWDSSDLEHPKAIIPFLPDKAPGTGARNSRSRRRAVIADGGRGGRNRGDSGHSRCSPLRPTASVALIAEESLLLNLSVAARTGRSPGILSTRSRKWLQKRLPNL